jgi:hypothetical protein
MSQRRRKYKRVEAFFSKVRPVTPDSPLRTEAKMPAPGTPAEDLTEGVEQTQAQPSAENTRQESVVSPTTLSPASGWQDFNNGIDCGQKMGFTYDQEKVTSLEGTPLPLSENALCVPLMISGTTIGIIQGDGSEAGWTAQEIEIVSAVAAKLARHLENLRLLKQNEKHTH